LPVAVVLFFSGFFTTNTISIGASMEWVNGQYHFSGGTQPWALMLAVGVLGIYLLLMYSPPTSLGGPIPGVFSRFVAFWIDFTVGTLAAAPILGVVPTLLEWRRTGEFEWTFERDTFVSYDAWLTLPMIFVLFMWLIIYFAWPLVRRIPSPGACVMGYQIVPDEGVKITWGKAVARTLLGFAATGGWFIAPFIARDQKRGKFWLDQVFRTHAERFV
jgi:uncharacterized RDD family membrane protein YckC